MNTLVIDHSYALGLAWDRSRFRNHGALHETPPGTGYFQRSLTFARGRSAPGSAVAVPPSPSLADLAAIRVRATVYTDPPAGPGRRQNIVEGHASFALFLNQDLALQGTFLAPNGQWLGIRSAANAVSPRTWHQIEYSYDGVSVAELLVDGVRVATSFDPNHRVIAPMVGPVRGVGPHGVFIGHWPEADDRYTLDGYVRDMQLYKRDPIKDAAQLADPCCMRDFDRWYAFAQEAKRSGFDAAAANRLLADLQAMGAELMASQRGGTQARTAAYDALIERLLYALRNRGSVPVEPALRDLVTWMRANLDMSDYAAYPARATKLLDALPWSPEELQKLGDELCFSSIRKTIEELVPKLHEEMKRDGGGGGGGRRGGGDTTPTPKPKPKPRPRPR